MVVHEVLFKLVCESTCLLFSEAFWLFSGKAFHVVLSEHRWSGIVEEFFQIEWFQFLTFGYCCCDGVGPLHWWCADIGLFTSILQYSALLLFVFYYIKLNTRWCVT